MKKYIGILAGMFLVGGASAALIAVDISNGDFSAGGTDWRVYGNGMATAASFEYDNPPNLNFDATNWAGGDYGYDRWGQFLDLGGTDSTHFQFSAKNNNPALGNRIGFHVVEFNGSQAAPTLTAADAVYYFDSGPAGTWTDFGFDYAVRNPATTFVNIGFKYYSTSDNVNFTLAAGNYNLDSVEAIPEPATMGLLAIFGAALVGLRRFRT